MKRLTISIAASALVGLVAACLDDSITGMRPLGFELTSNVTTAVVDEVVVFAFSASGTGLRLVYVDFGDGVVDTASYDFSTLEAEDTDVTHSFTTAGTFIVRGEAHANAGVAKDSVIMTIN